MAVMGEYSWILVHAAAGVEARRFLLLAGEPMGESVYRLGPFVMNTHDELVAAVNDSQSVKIMIQRD